MKGRIPILLSTIVLLASIVGCSQQKSEGTGTHTLESHESPSVMESVDVLPSDSSGAQTESDVSSTEQFPSTTVTEPITTEGTNAQTEAADKPVETESPTVPDIAEPTDTIPQTETPPVPPTDAPTEVPEIPHTEPPTEKPVAPPTEPEATEKPKPAETVPPETEAPYETIDTEALAAYGRKYAFDTYGYEGDTSMNLENSGYFPGIKRLLRTMEEGYTMVRNLVDAQYRNDMGMGYPVVEEINGVICRTRLNLYFKGTEDPNIFTVYCLYG